MEAIYLNQLMDMSVEYNMNGTQLKRNVLAGKTDDYGKMWVFVETCTGCYSSNKQWIELSFFKKWLNQMDIAA